MFTSAIILAAGGSTRMGFDKLLAEINGIPAFLYSVYAFEHSAADEIILVAPSEKIPKYEEILSGLEINKPLKVIGGADIRPRSALNGINAAKGELLLIHDAARPFVCDRLINDVIDAAKQHGAAIPAVKLKDTVKFCADGFVQSTPRRETLRAVQTPQAFIKKEYLDAVKAAGDRINVITDDAALFEAAGKKVAVTEGDPRNFKLTSPEDVVYAEAIAAKYPEFTIRRDQCSE
ncbi:MAG: 2-C-methyl-D-erythritol 4-phosphate cytidylyltransferase [Eubacterium sp.]|nr:2-C-methyl-D-erythritol 4-phosphate cytidylyltransferase [Eubacterium sp.]